MVRNIYNYCDGKMNIKTEMRESTSDGRKNHRMGFHLLPI
jgi:hypothetical protein